MLDSRKEAPLSLWFHALPFTNVNVFLISWIGRYPEYPACKQQPPLSGFFIDIELRPCYPTLLAINYSLLLVTSHLPPYPGVAHFSPVAHLPTKSSSQLLLQAVFWTDKNKTLSWSSNCSGVPCLYTLPSQFIHHLSLSTPLSYNCQYLSSQLYAGYCCFLYHSHTSWGAVSPSLGKCLKGSVLIFSKLNCWMLQMLHWKSQSPFQWRAVCMNWKTWLSLFYFVLHHTKQYSEASPGYGLRNEHWRCWVRDIFGAEGGGGWQLILAMTTCMTSSSSPVLGTGKLGGRNDM